MWDKAMRQKTDNRATHSWLYQRKWGIVQAKLQKITTRILTIIWVKKKFINYTIIYTTYFDTVFDTVFLFFDTEKTLLEKLIKKLCQTKKRLYAFKIKGYSLLILVLVVGVEPTRCCHLGILSPVRLPFRHTSIYYCRVFCVFFK